MLAVIKTGAKQYLVKKGDIIKIEKIEAKEGEKVVFDDVLLFDKGDSKPEIGNPGLDGVKVEGKVIKQGKSKKLLVLKHKPKKRYKVKRGHRQPFSEIEITKVG